VKTECNIAESSEEDCGSKRAVLPMMMMLMIVVYDCFMGYVLNGTTFM
jgi:hypothetical protein